MLGGGTWISIKLKMVVEILIGIVSGMEVGRNSVRAYAWKRGVKIEVAGDTGETISAGPKKLGDYSRFSKSTDRIYTKQLSSTLGALERRAHR